MLDISNIQIQIINELIALDTENFNGEVGENYICISLDTNILNIANLIRYFHPIPKYYFKNKDNSKEFLSLGSWKKFTNLYEYEEIQNIINNNEFIKIVGAQRFMAEPCAIEWHGVEDMLFYVPQIIFEKVGKKVVAKVILPVEALSNIDQKKECLHEIATTLDPRQVDYKETNNYIIAKEEIPNSLEWTGIINKSLDYLKKTDLKKVVLSRKNIVKFKKNICAEEKFLDALEEKRNDSYAIFFQFSQNQKFLSFTPETLFKVSGKDLSIDSLAGTRARAKNKQKDIELERELLSDKKELSEHRFVTEFIEQRMSPLVEKVTISSKESILKLKHVQHIHTKLMGTLTEQANIFDMIKSFHPTPAVGGLPRESAKDLIGKLEPYTRGFYASPLGFLSKDETEFSVAIRCALVNGDKMHIYGGCGVVEESLPMSEWKETSVKMKNFLDVLGSNN